MRPCSRTGTQPASLTQGLHDLLDLLFEPSPALGGCRSHGDFRRPLLTSQHHPNPRVAYEECRVQSYRHDEASEIDQPDTGVLPDLEARILGTPEILEFHRAVRSSPGLGESRQYPLAALTAAPVA